MTDQSARVGGMNEERSMELRMECLRLAVGVRGLLPNVNTTEIAEAYLKFVAGGATTKRD